MAATSMNSMLRRKTIPSAYPTYGGNPPQAPAQFAPDNDGYQSTQDIPPQPMQYGDRNGPQPTSTVPPQQYVSPDGQVSTQQQPINPNNAPLPGGMPPQSRPMPYGGRVRNGYTQSQPPQSPMHYVGSDGQVVTQQPAKPMQQDRDSWNRGQGGQTPSVPAQTQSQTSATPSYAQSTSTGPIDHSQDNSSQWHPQTFGDNAEYGVNSSPASQNKGASSSNTTANGQSKFAVGGVVEPPPQVANGTPSAFNPFNSRDVYNQNQGLGQSAFDQQQNWTQNYGALQDYYNQQAGNATQNVNNLYSDIWNGGGGYTDPMKSQVQDQAGLDETKNLNDQNFLTPGEQQQISGNPYAASDLFNGAAKNLADTTNQDASEVVNQANAGSNRAGGVLSNYKSDLNKSVDPTALGLSAGYKPGMDSTLNSSAAALQGAEGNKALDPTAQYLQQAGMTDQEVQDTAEAAARGVGASYSSAEDDLLQRANAAGTASPLGIAAARANLERNSSADQADALTNARLSARNAQRTAAGNVQNTQLNAAQYKSGLTSSNTLSQENANLAANAAAEQLRLGANQDIASRTSANANSYNSAALNQNNTNTTNQMNAAKTALDTATGVGEYNATNASNYMGQGEQNQAARAQTIAGARTSANAANQNTDLNISNANSNRAVAAYQPWVNAQTEGRTAAQGQQTFAGNQANANGQLRLGGTQALTGAAQNAANAYSNWGQNETNNGGAAGAFRNLDNTISAVRGGKARGGVLPEGTMPKHGGLINKHQTIEVGEHDRPEAILPLEPETPESERNPWEKMGAQLGKALGYHQPEKADQVDLEYPHMLDAVGMNPMAASRKKHFFLGGIPQTGSSMGSDMSSGNGTNGYDPSQSGSGNNGGFQPIGPIQNQPLVQTGQAPAPQINPYQALQYNTPQTAVMPNSPGNAPGSSYMPPPSSSYTTQAQPTAPAMPNQQSQPQGSAMPQQSVKPDALFGLTSDNPYSKDLMQQQGMPPRKKPLMPPQYRRGGLIGTGNFGRINMGSSFHLPQIALQR